MSDRATLRDINPTKSPTVDRIKKLTDELVNIIKENVHPNRCRAIAITNYEQASMWAIRATYDHDS